MRVRWLPCLAVLFASPAAAASFDCAKARTPQEHIICSDEALSAADSKLDGLYRTALLRLSAAGRASLRDSQRGWLRFLGQACPPAGSSVSSAEQQTQCLLGKYSQRTRDFDQIAIRKGVFLFTRIDHYSVTHLPAPANESDTGFATHHVAYPRIDGPLTAAAVRWNRHAVRSDRGSSCDARDGDTDLDYRLRLATARLISVSWEESEYCHGTPHGFGTSTVETSMLSPTVHPFTAADLFNLDKPWQERLSALTLAGVLAAAHENDRSVDTLNRDAVKNDATDPMRWLLQHDGLDIEFDVYELGLGYAFAPVVQIPWSDLRSVMVRDPPLP